MQDTEIADDFIVSLRLLQTPRLSFSASQPILLASRSHAPAQLLAPRARHASRATPPRAEAGLPFFFIY